MHQLHPVAVRGQPGPAPGQCVGVAVDADQVQIGVSGEQRRGMAAKADRGIDDDRGLAGGHRVEQVEDPVEHHGHVVTATSGQLAHRFSSFGADGRRVVVLVVAVRPGPRRHA